MLTRTLGAVVIGVNLLNRALEIQASVMKLVEMATIGWHAGSKLLSLAMRTGRIWTLAWSVAIAIANGDLALMQVMIKGAIRRVWTHIAATKAGQIATIAWSTSIAFFSSVMALFRSSTIAATASTWLMNAAFLASPITWIVAGIVALTAAIGAAIYYWDDLKAAFLDSAVFQFMKEAINGVIELLNLIPGVDIKWRATVLSDTPAMKVAQHTKKALPQPKNPALTVPVSAPDMEAFKGMVALKRVPQIAANGEDADNLRIIDYKNPQQMPQLPARMVRNITQTSNQTAGTVRQFGDVYITTPNGITPDQLAEWEALNAG
jgi:hypothetical protein